MLPTPKSDSFGSSRYDFPFLRRARNIYRKNCSTSLCISLYKKLYFSIKIKYKRVRDNYHKSRMTTEKYLRAYALLMLMVVKMATDSYSFALLELEGPAMAI